MGASTYYHWYDKRYRRAYAQGANYWTGNPEEIESSVLRVDAFLESASAVPGSTRVVEFGCGEGHLAIHLVRSGYDYLGVDLSPSAIDKALEHSRKVLWKDISDGLIVGDVTDPALLEGESFDVSIDNGCLHMLVTDPDRRKYLANVRRLLGGGGSAYFQAIFSEERFAGPIESFEEYLELFSPDLGALEEREAWKEGEPHTVHVSRLPARPDNEEGYRSEFEAAGFRVTAFTKLGEICTIYAKPL